MGEIIEAIDNSKNQLLDIVDNARKEHELLLNELNQLKLEMDSVIVDVDRLTIKDKMSRTRLAEVSKAFQRHSEGDIKRAYEHASDIKVALITAEKEEQMLRLRRNQLEISLKRAIDNIKNAEQVVNQVSIAVTFLKGEMMSVINELGADEIILGVKILEAQENERLRISRDIHDGPAQQIASLVMKADYCERIAKRDMDKGLLALGDLKDQAQKALVEVRAIIHDLRPMSLEDIGLSETIEAYVFQHSKEMGIKCKFKASKVIATIEPMIKVAVYRLVQEMFNNIKKHAHASYVTVHLEFGTKYMRLMVVDDGCGFELDKTMEALKQKQQSYGLIGIYERVHQLSGEIDIITAPNEGTTISVKLPVSREVSSSNASK